MHYNCNVFKLRGNPLNGQLLTAAAMRAEKIKCNQISAHGI